MLGKYKHRYKSVHTAAAAGMCKQTYPDYRVELRHGDLLRPVDGRGHLLLMFLRQERQYLRNNGIESFRYFRLKEKKNSAELRRVERKSSDRVCFL